MADERLEPMTQAAPELELPERLRLASGIPAGPPRTYLMSGRTAKCGLCGEPLEAKPSTEGTRGYACLKSASRRTAGGNWKAAKNGCGRIRIAADPFEEHVAVKVLGRLATPEAVEAIAANMSTAAQTGSALADEIGQVETDLRELGRDYGEGLINRDAFLAAQDTFDQRLRNLRTQVQQLVFIQSLTDVLTPEDLADWWENRSSLQERHDLIRALVDEIRVMPARLPGSRRFDPERVIIVWSTV